MISEPFYFGHNKSCFGHFTRSSDAADSKSVLIVPSLFGESSRSHWLTREAAKRLSMQGYNVLRFDFEGDGNSCSNTSDVSIDDWIQNIQEAYSELQNRLELTSVSVFAIRFGAGLSLVALKALSVKSYVLLDPLLSTKKMYETFVGVSSSDKITGNYQVNNRDPFVERIKPTGLYEMGLGNDFSKSFLQLPDISMPACDCQVITTAEQGVEYQNISKAMSVTKVNYHCDWSKQDLPLIFSPKLLSTICDYI